MASGRRYGMTIEVPVEGDLHKSLLRRLSSRMRIAESEQGKHHDRWRKAEDQVLAYVPENEADSRRRRKRENLGQPNYTTIQIPYTFAQLMAVHTYWTSVFFARNPIHQFFGYHGEGEMQIQAVEALIAYQVEVGRMLAPYYLWLYDSGKYGVGWLGQYWDEEIIQYGAVQEVEDPAKPGETVLARGSMQTKGYCGNKVYNVSPFDAFPDPRVTVGNFQKGEFFGIRKRIAWNDILRRRSLGYYTNFKELEKRSASSEIMTENALGSPRIERPQANYFIEDDAKHPAVVEAYEVYVDLIPNEWKLGNSGYPEKWVFTMTTDHTLIFGTQPLGLIHGQFPVDVLEPETEAYGTYNRGIPETIEPIQNTMDWLWNSHAYNVRASLNMGIIVDPSKLVLRDIRRGGPGFMWRMRPEAYGLPIDTFFKQVAMQDVTQNNLNDLNLMFSIGERVFGINDQILGMLAAGGRKTATEVRTSTGFGTNRLKTTAEYMSATGFSSHSAKLVSSSQQHYDEVQKLRIVGDLAGMAMPGFLSVSPEDIAGRFGFMPVDGTLPVDRFAQVTLWKEIIPQLASIPQIFMQYDLAKIFVWVAQLAGIKNLARFKITPDAALATQAQLGNVVPLRSAAGAAGSTDSRLASLAGMEAAGGNSNATLAA